MKIKKIKDIKIIYYLSKNSREPYSKIAKRISISNDSVKNRIEKLKKNGIIKSFKTNINYKKLGFLEYDIYLKLRNYNNIELKNIINLICKNDYVTWVGTCFGKYDLRISLIVNNIENINDFLIEINKKIKYHFVDYKILYLLQKYKIEQKKIISNLFDINEEKIDFEENNYENNYKNILKDTYLTKSKQKIKLENKDKDILNLLNKNPQCSLVKISNELNLTPEACKYRINELIKKEVISSFSLIIDGNKLNKILAIFLFKIENEDINQLINFIQFEENISSFVHMLGDWNYSISVFANNVQQIHIILMNFRNKFPNIIKEYELILLFETFKYPIIPKIIFK